MHLPDLIRDLALILIAAGVVSIIFRRLKQPVVLGYIIAGLLVGPHITLFPTVTDIESVKVWAEIGVIFLMFTLGLEFSFKKLATVGGAASITTLVEVTAMVGLGYLTGQLFGWKTMDSLFLGGILAISSTTIIIRAFDELGVRARGFATLVFGVLIVEDLVAVVLLVLLSTVALTQQFAGGEMLMSVLKLSFFLVLWFLSGIFILPSFLKRARRFINEETLLVMSLGLCFLMVVLANQAGFSSALGAFVMGSILAETTEAERVEHLIAPVKDLFAAIFFVSVGMLIDPKILVEQAVPVAVITLVTIFGKIMSTMAGTLIAGRSLRHSVQTGFSLAQIGEFSFIIASLGLSLKVTSDFLYPVAVGVSIITTFATPYLIKSADGAYDFIARTLPVGWKQGLERYSNTTESASSSSEWSSVSRAYIIRVGLNGVLITGIFLALEKFLPDWLQGAPGFAIAVLVTSPFFWAFAVSRPDAKGLRSLWRNRRNRGAIAALEVSRMALAITLLGILASRFIEVRAAFGLVVVLAIAFFILFRRYLAGAYKWFEKRFMENLTARESAEAARVAGPELAPWDAHIVNVDIPQASVLVGLTLEELKIREKFGITIALIKRGANSITAPSRHQRVFPGDELSVIGTDEQIAQFKIAVGEINPHIGDERVGRYKLRQVTIDEESPFARKTIRDCGLRDQVHGLVVGIERAGQRFLNPDSMMIIEPEDRLWIVGDDELLRKL